MAPYGRLRPVDKKFRQREILAGIRPIGGFLQYGAPTGGFFADRRVIYFASS